MSDKHNDQKLIIENFNKWVNEEKREEEEIDETAGHYMEAKPIDEEEQLEMFGEEKENYYKEKKNYS